MKYTVSLAVMALVSNTSAITLKYIDHYGDQYFQQEEKAYRDGVDAQMEQEALRKAREADYKRRFNVFDGLLHNDDGTLQDPSTGEIVHNSSLSQAFIGLRTQGVDTADRNMNSREETEAQNAKINKLDGLIHNADGTTTDPTTGQIVNNELQLESDHRIQQRGEPKAGDRDTERKEYIQDHLNPFDGLLHNDNGTLTDPTTGEMVDPQQIQYRYQGLVQRPSNQRSIPEFVDKYHTETMNDANAKEADRLKAIQDQAASDAWRGKKNTAFAQKEWGAKTDEATVDRMHKATLEWAGNVDSNRVSAIDAQEKSDEWRGTGPKTAWEHWLH